jgi:hypothetical protein
MVNCVATEMHYDRPKNGYKQKKLLGQPTNALSLSWWHFVPLQTHTMMA